MEGQLQKRQVKLLEASEGEAVQNTMGSNEGAIHLTSGENSSVHNTSKLMEELVARPNMLRAYRRVIENKGSPGVDGVTTDELKGYVQEHWERIKQELLEGRYKPQAILRVEIPKPNGGTRNLGIPTVVDRLIQQAMHQVLSPVFEPGFSEHSYGFRAGRNAHQAVQAAQRYIREGRRWVVDIDLEKFFDTVKHDVLMERIRRKVEDPRVLTLIRRYLTAGIMSKGVITANKEGTPQGGPLSPLLSNIMLTDLDKELERRGHAFCRYADDCNIYVKSEKAGQRVLDSTTKFLENKLKLRVNREKSAVGRPWVRKFLGFSFTSQHKTRIRVHETSVKKIRVKVKELCSIGRGWNMQSFIKEKLNPAIRGWSNYFKTAETHTFAVNLDAWVRRRLRVVMWRQWVRCSTKKRKLMAQGIPEQKAFMMAYSSKGAWRMCGFKAMADAFPTAFFEKWGLVSVQTIVCSS